MSLTVHGTGPSLNCFPHSASLDRCRRPPGRSHFSFFAAEAVAEAVSVPDVVQNQIVTELPSTSFYERPRIDPRRQVAPVNIAANYAGIYWRAPSIAL
jgi:hypothetical protein